MFRVIDKKDTGKTRKLLEECSKNNGLFICEHPEKVLDKCKAYGIELNFTYAGYDKSFKNITRPIYIDELEKYVLYNSRKSNISGYSLSTE